MHSFPHVKPGLPPAFTPQVPAGAGGFAANTRRKVVRQPAMVKPAGGGLTEMTIQSTGLLARIWIKIAVTIAGTDAANPLGVSSVVRRLSLRANSGLELHSWSGPGYSWLLMDHLESEYYPVLLTNQGREAVSDDDFRIDMLVPVCVSLMDFTGLVLLQSKQISVTLQIDWETDVNVCGTGTVDAVATPYVEYFTVPTLPEDRPNLGRAHLILQDDRTVAGAGEYVYEPIVTPRYLQIIHGLNYGVAGADDVTDIRLRVEQSNYIYDADIGLFDMEWAAFHGLARPAGVWSYDFMASSGLGNYGGARDLVNTGAITSFESVFQAGGVGDNLTTIRRMLIDVT